MSTAEDRKAAAAARQAKLLAKGQARLAKITGAAKGEGRVISSSAEPSADARPAAREAAPASLVTDDDPEEVDLAALHPTTTPSQRAQQDQLAALGFPADFGAGGSPFGGFPGMGGAGAGAAGGEDFLAQMMASMGGAGGPGGESPFGGAFGAGGPGGGMGGMGAFGGPPGMQPPTSPFAPVKKTLIDRLFPLVHLLAMVGLAWYAIALHEPGLKLKAFGWMGKGEGIDWHAWARLASAKQGEVLTKSGEGLMLVPLVWLFVSVELVLQTTRLFLVRNRPAPPGILSSILPLLSSFAPRLGLVVNTATHYISLASICLNDFAVLVFCMGLFILVAKWKVGDDLGPVQAAAEVVDDAWEKIKGEL